MKLYRVFTGAPHPTQTEDSSNPSWQTFTTEALPLLSPTKIGLARDRLSLIYQNVIFDGDGEQADESEGWESQDSSENINCSEPSIIRDLSQFQDTDGSLLTTHETSIFSEDGSISCFPTFDFSLKSISSLSSIMSSRGPGVESFKVSLLLGVLEVDGPSTVRVKTGLHAGVEVGLLKIIAGDDSGAVCRISVWREIAELWGGIEGEPGLKKGDVVLLENLLVPTLPHAAVSRESSEAKLHFTASPNLNSQARICYRTLPSTRDDHKLRPDLRLAESVPAVRKVSDVVAWMERMAGLGPG